ncbi:hypothetical protein D7V86_07430 [bacterium D16-51]|nr:hypothetical protein D7V96_10195 [bacterium D16-59]RKI60907.1 hypothetical protein D7V86_07430 [bacterium D16-51]
MPSIFGTSDSGSNYFDSYYSMTNNSNMSGLFGNTTNFLGDYSMIKSGTYKKLLTAYYKTTDTDKKSEGTEDEDGTTKKGDSAGKLLNVKGDAEALKDAVDALRSSDLYKPVDKDKDGQGDRDEKGNFIYDTEKLQKNLKQFVEAYNSYLDSSGGVDNKGILSKTLRVVKQTASNKNLFKDLGISIGKDNKLTFDEDKFKEAKAKVTTASSLFAGMGSYGYSLTTKTSEVANLANSAANSNRNASSYTYNGVYSVTGRSNSTLDKYL